MTGKVVAKFTENDFALAINVLYGQGPRRYLKILKYIYHPCNTNK